MNGKLIAIEGLDGSGKGTQTKLLTENWKTQGKPVFCVSFPNYGSDAANLLETYLHGGFGTDPNAVNPYAASTFFAIDRYASFHRAWKAQYSAGGIILADRYTTSNAIHQCAKLPSEKWEEFLHWLFQYEYEQLGLPAPDAVIYLRVCPEVSQKLLSGRYAGVESKKDIHESNTEYLAQCRAAADFCADYLGWNTVQCDAAGEMRPPEKIAREVLTIAEAAISAAE